MAEKEELLEEERESKGKKDTKSSGVLVTVLVILLLFVFTGIGFAVGGLHTVGSVKTNSSVSTKSSNTSAKIVEVDSMIKNLWSRVQLSNLVSYTRDSVVNYDGIKVSEMSDDIKGRYASSYYYKTLKTLGYSSYVDEDDVRYAYDSLFGVGTYKSGQDIYYSCTPFTYDAKEHTYKLGEGGCGGTSSYAMIEVPYKAELIGNELKITSVMAFYHYGYKKLYKTIDDVEVNAIEGFDGDETDAKEYIKNNTSSLANYVYTFELDSNNFYKFVGYEKVK